MAMEPASAMDKRRFLGDPFAAFDARARDAAAQTTTESAPFRFASTKAGVNGNALRRGGGLHPARLKRVLDRIETGLAEPLHIQDLAAIAVLSPRHFTAAFRRSVGLAPYRYVLERRIERARWLLAIPRHSIADVAYQIGFSSQAHFTTVFGNRVGMTPGAFRASIQSNRRDAKPDLGTCAGN